MRFFKTSFFLLLFAFAGYTHASLLSSFKTDTGNINLTDFKGQVIYLDFWASWCIPCRKSFPWMNSMQQRFAKQGLKIIAVNLDQEPEKAREFLEKIPAKFTIAYDHEGRSATEYKVKGMPSSYLIDRNGKIVFSHIGFRNQEKHLMEEKIKQLLKSR